MLPRLPPELSVFIESEVANGKYTSADEAVSEAVRLLQVRELHLACLKSDVEEGLTAFENGNFVTIRTDADRQALIDDISCGGRERLQAALGNS